MEFLRSAACESLNARRVPGFEAIKEYETLCVSFDQNDQPKLVLNSAISADQLSERLRDDALFGIDAKDCMNQGGLQLLICKYVGSARIREQERQGHPMPFADLATYEMVEKALQLPAVFVHHFKERHTVPIHVSQRGNISNIVFQTPAYGDLFISMALSYDCLTGITKGLLIPAVHTETYHMFERYLQGLLPFTRYPLTCMAAIYHVLDRMSGSILNDIDLELEAITAGMKNLPPEMLKTPQPNKKYSNVQEMHLKLVAQHKRLTRSIFDVIDKIGEVCVAELAPTSKMSRIPAPKDLVGSITAARDELHQYVETIAFGTRFRTQERRRLLKRIDVQLQELYNMITTEIAKSAAEDNKLMINMTDETVKISKSSYAIAEYGKSYSKNMGAISLLTVIFLPATALASVFSMSPFFSVDGVTAKLQVSRQIWIYFALIVPITLLMLLTWAAYARRSMIRAVLCRQLPLQDDEEREMGLDKEKS